MGDASSAFFADPTASTSLFAYNQKLNDAESGFGTGFAVWDVTDAFIAGGIQIPISSTTVAPDITLQSLANAKDWLVPLLGILIVFILLFKE